MLPQPMLEPSTTSLKAFACCGRVPYSSGFRNPSADLPAARRASFSSAMMPARRGARAGEQKGAAVTKEVSFAASSNENKSIEEDVV